MSRRRRTPAEIRAIALNMVFADASNIGWQVTGRYPNRREGEGLLPSPGWEGRYDWDGYADPMLHPYDQDPAQGWLGTANQRVIPMATACSCPTPGRRRNAANVWLSWPGWASMTPAA
jgi:acyl-homoserine lactone acylase PvdQ